MPDLQRERADYEILILLISPVSKSPPLMRRPNRHRLFTGPPRPRTEDTAPIAPSPQPPITDHEPLFTEPDASCFHCGGRTTELDKICLTCRGRDPRKLNR